MDIVQKVLTEKSSELVQVLTRDTGMSRRQAERFLREAGPALIDSYRWQEEELAPEGLASPTAARDILSGISGRALASKVGMSSERTWDGLRSLVPAVVRSGARARTMRSPSGSPGWDGTGGSVDVARRVGIGIDRYVDPRRSGSTNGEAGGHPPHPSFRFTSPGSDARSS
jgi:hypothetical protein